MKRTFIILFCTVIFSGAFTQTNVYFPLPSDSTDWREYAGGFQNGYCSDYQYFISGDTLINGLLYKKITKMGVVYIQDIQGYCTNIIDYYYTINYAGAYRNDSVNKKVYGMFYIFTSDTLLYNFNLNLGDTLPPSALNNPARGTNVVTGLDSVLIGNHYHKRFAISWANWYNSHVSLIEGIGSTYGLFGLLTPIGQQGTTLYCVVENGQTVYHNPSYPCDLFTGILNKVPKDFQFELFPNPVQDCATLNFNFKDKKLDLLIFNIYGQKVSYYKNIINGSKINTSILTSGMYFYIVLDEDVIITTGKLLKIK